METPNSSISASIHFRMDERRVDNFAYATRAQLSGFLRRLACIRSQMTAKCADAG
jgi:hypothetical protein